MSPAFFQDLIQFQPTLAQALGNLDRADRDLEQGRKDLVKQKAKLPPEQFRSEITRLGNYQRAIGEATQLGKSLGDAFAWFFYQNELPRLYKHLEHEPVTEIPTGTGNAGELAFIKNVPVVDGHLVLYHGITTILRHGDVSLIDLDTFKLTCLGELKSRATDDGEITITAHFIGPRDRPLPPFVRHAPVLSQLSEPLPPKRLERFRRQLEGMAASFKPIPAREELKIEQDTYFPVLMKLIDQLERADVVYEQCGEGLLLVGFRTDATQSLFDKLFSTFDAMSRLQGLGPHVQRLIDMRPTSARDNANSIIISPFGRATLPGATPLFWCPLSLAFLEKLFFLDAIIVTVYNPAHLIRKLREQGYQVRLLANHRYDIHKTVAKHRISLGGFDYWLRLIQDHLVDEEVVLRILSHAHSLVESGKVKGKVHMPFYFSQQFGPQNLSVR
jgi:hypothetical protein